MTTLSTSGTRLQIGDLVAYLDADGGFLRAIALPGEEVFRGIGFVVRDQNWGSYSLQADPQIEQTSEKIIVRVAGRIDAPDGLLDWSLIWTLAADGLSVACDCTSVDGFPTTRVGFVVLHSVPAAKGQAISIAHDDGQVEAANFPDLISPHQPFMGVTAMDYTTSAGHRLHLRFEGEVFETEDQRNWTDASYKTYSRPLSKPFPYRITTTEPERQRVDLSFLKIASAPVEAFGPPVVVCETTMPRLGVGVSPGASVDGLNEAITALSPGFTAIEIDLAGDPDLVQTRLILSAVPGAIRLDIRRAEAEAVLRAMTTLAPLLAGRSVIGISLWDADAALVAAARVLLPGLPIGSGTGAFFTELNRGKNWPQSADYLTWTSTPTYHGATDDTIGESIGPLGDILRTAKTTFPGQRFQIGPHTLGARFNPNATTPEGLSRPADADPRQGDSIAAAWMLGMLAGYADDVIDTMSFFEAQGPRGLMDAEGQPTPAAALFKRLAAFQGQRIAILSWPGQPRLSGLRLSETAYCIANLHHEPAEALLPEGGSLRIDGFDTVWQQVPD
ncbi:hypothetical protein ACELLULO517_03915 [Acidisoma cellulosilytica]|uniref:Uncharacterized protein n=1 Tax=Acidisoma cellulosilyticum TaxID=2802395 RepID=A0A963Z029_9PROT|nr:hypothetical protein [Acidisoma cellulosilyticum]MCB8879368.1 hypothetical protein [Acidisoma cellulosilyticum]